MPLALPAELLSGYEPGSHFDSVRLGPQPGHIGWMSWDGNHSIPALANALTPPGTASRYRDPLVSDNTELKPGGWMAGMPGVRNAAAVRRAMDALIGQTIRVPLYDQTRNHGENLVYRLTGFAHIRLDGYRLSGVAHASFTYLGDPPCRENQPPKIRSQPHTQATTGQHWYYQIEASDPDPDDILRFQLVQAPQGMQIDREMGEVSWWVDDAWQGNHPEPNAYCHASGGSIEGGQYADIVVVVDESGSMRGEHAWIQEMVLPLESHLLSQRIGEGHPNRYGLLGFERNPRPINVGTGLMDTWEAMREASDKLELYGGTEDGWRAIDYVLENYPLRPEAAQNLILVTDEGRDIVDANLTYNGLLSRLQQNGAILNAVVNARFECVDQAGNIVSALGMDAEGTGYRADGQGGYLICEQARATWGHRNTVNTLDAYVPLALDSGGAAWDLDYLRAGGVTAQSFTSALMAIKTREILEHLPPRPLADLTIAGIVELEDAIEVVVGNRGLKDVEESVHVELLNPDGGVAVTQILSGLTMGGYQTVQFATPDWEASHLSARVLTEDEQSECTTSNNQLSVPWITLRATDQGGLYDEQRFTLDISTANSPPEIVSTAPTVAAVGGHYHYPVEAQDLDRGDALRFGLKQGPTGMYIDPVQGHVNFRPVASQLGSHDVTIQVSDLLGAQAEQHYVLHVEQSYEVPRIVSSASMRIVQGYTYQYDIDVHADATADLEYDLLYAPESAQVEQGKLRWEVPQGSAGQQVEMVLRVMDQHGNYDLQFISLTITASNEPPQFHSHPPEWVELGQTWHYPVEVSDPDGDSVLLTLLEAPHGMVLDTDGATLTWIPVEHHSDPAVVVLQAQDSLGDSAEQHFEITVYDGPNQPPVFDSSPELHALVGQMWQYQVVVSDPNGDPLQVDLIVAPAHASWDQGSLSLAWLPQAEQLGENRFTLEVSDPRGGVAIQSFTVQVAKPNQPPEFISIPPTDIESGEVYYYSAQAIDPDGDSVSYHLIVAPAGALLNETTGQLQWLAGSPGNYAFELHAEDGRSGVAVQVFSVQVSEPLPSPSLCNAIAP